MPPSVRPRTASGTMRCSRVVLTISTSRAPAAVTAIATSATPNASAGAWPRPTRPTARPTGTDQQRRRQPPPEHERPGDKGAEDAADADGRVEQAGAGCLADLEDIDRQQDGDHAQAAEDEGADHVEQTQTGQRPRDRPQHVDAAPRRGSAGSLHPLEPPGSAGETRGAVDGSRSNTSATTPKVSALSRKAHGDRTEARAAAAAIAGPTKKARLSRLDQALLAGPSSDSSRTSDGR